MLFSPPLNGISGSAVPCMYITVRVNVGEQVACRELLPMVAATDYRKIIKFTNPALSSIYQFDSHCERSILPCWSIRLTPGLLFIALNQTHVMIKGPIVIVDDDKDDQEVYEESIKDLGISNEIHFFDRPKKMLEYLLNTEEQPFIILSDINMPEMTGLELKKNIQDDPYLCTKGIPFVFISTNASRVSVRHAHALSVQGFFEKPSSIEGFKQMLRTLFEYWELCKHINNT